MFVTYPEFQIKSSLHPYHDEEACCWGTLIYREHEQHGWFTATVLLNEFTTILQSVITPYPHGISLIVKHIQEQNILVNCIQCALFNKQSNTWAFHAVEEIWRIKPDSSSEIFVELFRLEGQGLLDGFGKFVELKLGDQLELVYQKSRT